VNGKKTGWLSLVECLKPKETVLLCFMQATDFVMPMGPRYTVIKDPKEISKKQLQQLRDWFYFSLAFEFPQEHILNTSSLPTCEFQHLPSVL
jgi:hypothetical protein